MAAPRQHPLFNWLKRWLPARAAVPSEIARARAVIAAVDAGGMPLNPLAINDIARRLGLEVSRKARVEDTIERLRAAVHHHDARVRPASARAGD